MTYNLDKVFNNLKSSLTYQMPPGSPDSQLCSAAIGD